MLTGDGERKDVRSRAIGSTGWLYANGNLVAEVSFSAGTHSGDLGVFTGLFRGSTRDGAVTRHENFHGQALD